MARRPGISPLPDRLPGAAPLRGHSSPARRGEAEAADPRFLRSAAHAAGALGGLAVVLFLAGLAIPPADSFPDSKLRAFHTFFVGALADQTELELPDEHEPGWLETVEPGDVLFLSRGHVTWGEWSHVAVVVEAPEDALWVRPGSLAVLDASIHDGMYYAPIELYAEWPRVVVRRASNDPAVRRRIAEVATGHRWRMFAGVARGSSPYSNCSTTAIAGLKAVGLDPGVDGWRTPDELFRSAVWVD